MSESTEFMSGRVPASLKRKVKAQASLRGLDLAEAIREGMAAWLGESESTSEVEPLTTEHKELIQDIAVVLMEDSAAAGHARALIELAMQQYKTSKETQAGNRTKGRKSGT